MLENDTASTQRRHVRLQRDAPRGAEQDTAGGSWSRQYERRRAIAGRFGPIFALPVVRRAREVLLERVSEGACVLEVGAGDRRMKALLERERPGVRYASMDVDPLGEHDYRDLGEIESTFDVVFAFEVAEHLTLEELHLWLPRLAELLAPGGALILSTPNTFYPPAYLRDVTHKTPLCYDELGALVEAVGLRVERIVRVYHDPLHRKLLRRYLFGWLFRLLGLDFAGQIVMVALRESAGGSWPPVRCVIRGDRGPAPAG